MFSYILLKGYFGGITWAILTARVCQLYPNQTASVIVARFFKIYSRWHWPNPVLLTTIHQPTNTGLLNLKVWDPRASARTSLKS